MQDRYSVIILAAGFSSRMGSPKLSLGLPGGITFLEYILQQYENFGCGKIIVVVNSEGRSYLSEKKLAISSEINIVVNHHPEKGRFYSISKGLSALEDDYPVFIHNVDNPFADKELLNALYTNRSEADLIKPVYKNKGGHPVLISNNIVRDILTNKNYDIHLNNFLSIYSSRSINSTDKRILTNINTESDYKNLSFFSREEE